MIRLETKLQTIRGIGPKFISRLGKMEILNVRDLLWHFPSRYEDFSKVVKISDLEINQVATVQCTIKQISLRRSFRRRLFLVEATAMDESGEIGVIWFNQPYLTNILTPGKIINLAGKVVLGNDDIYLSNPMYEFVSREGTTKHTGRLTPIYKETKGLTSKAIRYLTKPVLDHLEKMPEWIPETILKNHDLPEINLALRKIHFPETLEEVERARKRFAFEDLFLLQLMNIRNRLELEKYKAPKLPEIAIKEISRLESNLPFSLTTSQKKSLEEIIKDLTKGQPMNRLLQGDVGSGKTVIAALGAIAFSLSNYQTAFMAPTEVLAKQHYKTLIKLFPDFKKGIALLTSSKQIIYYEKNLEIEINKKTIIETIKSSNIKIIIGTQSLIQDTIGFENLALVVIDEQHRFGVGERAKLIKTTSDSLPHLLSMSATPIPRTLSLTIFGDLELSTIDELPIGRKPIITKIVAPINRDKAYNFIRQQIKKGRQAFVICPRINPEEEEKIQKNELSKLELKSVIEEYEKLSKKIFPDLNVAMLHGKMKPKEKERTMQDFYEKKSNILVSTSVIEVGIDVPNASIMLIEGADRFGLAQLYQFRGRVGRSEHQSFCFLFTDSGAKTTEERLKALIEAKNGFELAEKDLAIRGPGEFLGQKQTGVPDLAMKAIRNMDLVKNARDASVKILSQDSELSKYPALKTRLITFAKQVHKE